MKIKSFAMLVMIGLAALSFNNAAIAADDMGLGGDDDGAMMLADNSGGSGMGQGSSNNSGDNSSGNASGSGGSPDTATGDDDY